MTQEELDAIRKRDVYADRMGMGLLPAEVDRRALIVEIDRLRAAMTWQPIDSAPEVENKSILLCAIFPGTATQCSFMAAGPVSCHYGRSLEADCFDWIGWESTHWAPTHWAPSPTWPTEAGS